MVLADTQLRLARRTIEDVHLPWEHPQRPDRRVLTAARVRQAFPQLLATLDTPANAPNPAAAHQDVPKAPDPAAHRGSLPSKKPPESATTSVVSQHQLLIYGWAASLG